MQRVLISFLIFISICVNLSIAQVWPISGNSAANSDVITSVFGPRITVSGYQLHWGLDIRCTTRTDVKTIKSGKVNDGGGSQTGSAGYWVEIKHSDNTLTRYLHLAFDPTASGADQFDSRFPIVVGTQVSQGQLIAMSGWSGLTKVGDAHLHLRYHPNYILSDELLDAWNPLVELAHNESNAYRIENIGWIGQGGEDNSDQLVFDVYVSRDRVDIGSIRLEISNTTDVNNASITQTEILHDESDARSVVGIIDFDMRSNVDYNGRDPVTHTSDQEFNGVRIEPANYPNSADLSGEHKYIIYFNLDPDVVKALRGNIRGIKVIVKNSWETYSVETDTWYFPIYWTENWPYSTSNSNWPEQIEIGDEGKILIQNSNSSPSEHVEFNSEMLVESGGTLELENGPNSSSRTWLYVLPASPATESGHNIWVKSGGTLKLGNYSRLENYGKLQLDVTPTTLTDAKINSYISINGTVTSDQGGLSDVTMDATGTAPNMSTSTTTGFGGSYKLSVAAPWTGTVTASKSDYTFEQSIRSPFGATISYDNIGTDQTLQNYTASPITGPTVKISGYVRNSSNSYMGNVKVTATPQSGTPVYLYTDNDMQPGAYSFTLSSPWTGSISPTATGYTFSPNTYTAISTDQSNQDFTGTPIPGLDIALEGLVLNSSGDPMPGVTVIATDNSNGTITDVTITDGSYSIKVISPWSGVVIPSAPGYQFTSQPYNNISKGQYHVFNGTVQTGPTYTIQGTITDGSTPISGVTLKVTDLDDNLISSKVVSTYPYTISIPSEWTGKIKPSKSNYSFDNVFLTYANPITQNLTDQNITGRQIPSGASIVVTDISPTVIPLGQSSITTTIYFSNKLKYTRLCTYNAGTETWTETQASLSVKIDGTDLLTPSEGYNITQGMHSCSTALSAGNHTYYIEQKEIKDGACGGDATKPATQSEITYAVSGTFYVSYAPVTLTLNPATFIGSGSGGKYIVNNTDEGASWSGFIQRGVIATIEAVPPAQWSFRNWSDGDKINPRTLTPDNNVTLNAVYSGPQITAVPGTNGYISPPGATTVIYGGSLTYAVEPDPCYDIVDVFIDGASVGPVTSYTFTNVTSDHTISASFNLIPTAFRTGNKPTSIATGDLNNDGKLDMVVANTSSNTVSIFINTTLDNAKTPTYANRVDLQTRSNGVPAAVLITDRDGDGKQDIIVAAGDYIQIFHNNLQTNGATVPDFSNIYDHHPGLTATPSNVVAGDMNCDGDMDLVVTYKNSSWMSIIYRTPSGELLSGIAHYNLHSNISSIAIGDLNGDTKPEIAIANSNIVSIFLNETYMPTHWYSHSQIDIPTCGGQKEIALSDLNGDSKQDMIILNSNGSGNYASVFLNRTPTNATTFTFDPKVDVNTIDNPCKIVACDLIRDTKPDLVITNSDANSISVFKNETQTGSFNPSFSRAFVLFAGLQPTGIAFGNMNNNGELDLAIANNGSNTVSVLLDRGKPSLPEDKTIVSGTISSNTTWSGQILVIENVTVTDGATLTINPGTDVAISSDCKIEISGGSKIIAMGTSANPIRFMRYENNAWNCILLNGNDNQFSWCVFDGGNTNVHVQSTGSTFTNCTFSNGSSGISAFYAGLQRSTFSLDNCVVENNLYGISLYGSNPSINQTTIKYNLHFGVYLTSSSVGRFTNNVVKNNGLMGIYVNPDSYFVLGNGDGWHPLKNPITDPPDGAGRDSIADNGYCEIFVEYGANFRGGMFDGVSSLMAGYNKISAHNLYICNVAYTLENESGVTTYYTNVWLHKNRWGESAQADPEKLSGSVDCSYPLTFNPVGTPGAGAVPSLTISNPKSGSTPKTLMTAAIAEKLSDQQSASAQKQFIVDLKNKILEKRSKTMGEEESYYCAKLLGIHAMLKEFDPNDETKEMGIVKTQLAEYRARLLSNQLTNPIERLCSEAALVNDVQEAAQNGEVNRAQTLIKQYIPYIQNKDNKRAILFAEFTVNERLGNYEKAWEALQAVKAIGPDEDRKKAYVAPSYAPLESMLKEKAKTAGIVLSEEISTEAPIPLPKAIALQQNYPNPFNPMTTIKYDLPLTSHVTLKIYDIMGREVAVLADGMKEAGYQSVTFNASRLASGIYFSRLTVKEQNGNLNVQTKKMLLVK